MSKVTVAGLVHELINMDELSFDDERTLKRYAGGMSRQQITDGLKELDADAWFAVVLMSVQRKLPTFSESDLGKLNFTDILLSLEMDEPEVADVPPTDAPAAAASPARRGAKS